MRDGLGHSRCEQSLKPEGVHPMFERIMSIGWILAGLVVVGIVAYETWHPCGLRSMRHDTMQWIDRCSDNGKGDL